MYELELSGAPYAMGLAHGEQFREQIQNFSTLRYELLKEHYLPGLSLDITQVVAAQEKQLNSFPNYYEELQGIAQGASVSISDLIILNNYTDLIDFTKDDKQQEAEGCSTFFLPGNAGWVYGQSWDMHSSAEDYLCHLSIKNTPRIELLSLVGCLAIAGRNEYGVSVFVNNLRCKEVSCGVIWPILVRMMLHKRSAKECVEVLQQYPATSGRNYLIVDSKSALNVETTGRQVLITQAYPRDTTLFHTNHYLSELKQHEYEHDKNVTTFWRYNKLVDFFSQPRLHLSAEELAQSILTKNTAHSVYVSGDGSEGNFKTCGGLIIDRAKKEFTLFKDSYNSGVFKKSFRY